MIKSGEIVQIKDSAYDGLTGLTVYGNTVQNLWANPSGTMNGVTVTPNSDGSIAVNGTASNTSIVQVISYALRPTGKYTLSIDKSVSSVSGCGVSVQWYKDNTAFGNILIGSGSTLSGTFTVPSDAEYCKLKFRVPSDTTVSGTYRVMLNGGSEPEPWCPPGLNGVDELSVVCAGKNLIPTVRAQDDEQNSRGLSASVNADGSYRITGTSTSAFAGPLTGVSVLLARGTHTLSGRLESLNGKGYIYAQIIIDGRYITAVDGPKTIEIERAGVYVVTFTAPTQGATFDGNLYAQLEIGPTATAYEPPAVTSTTIDLDGHALNSLPDGTRDELHVDGDGRVTLIKRVQDIHLDGSTTWDMFTNPFVGYAAYWCNFGGDATGEDYTMLCDKLIVGSEYANSIYSSGLNGVAPYLREPSFATDADGVKTWIGSNTPNVVVSLANPKVIELGTIDLPKLRKLVVNTVYVSDDTPATIDVEYNRYRSGCDGFKVGGKHNYWDMHACLASRDTGVPEKKLSTVTVPYMSGFYDLSKLYGAIAFESREVTYSMEFVEDTTEELQARKSAILQWLSMVHDADIVDDDFPGYHFHGSYSDASWEEDDSGLQGSLEVTFLCHPFLVADGETSVSLSAGEKTVTVEGQPVNAYAVCASGSATVKFRGVQQSVGTTPVRLSAQLQSGDNAVTVTGSAVTLSWNEERV